MSRFFNYNAANMARLYDRMRKPHGVDVIAGLLHVHCNKPFQVIIYGVFMSISKNCEGHLLIS